MKASLAIPAFCVLATVTGAFASPAQAQSLAFLGPKGTYSDQAALQWQSRTHDVDELAPKTSLSDVVNDVVSGRADKGILPIVATVSSFPLESHAATLKQHDPGFRVVGEISLPIVSQLLIKKGSRPSDITTIMSHPNALKEASVFLASHYGTVALKETKSTAAAAEIVAQGDGTVAAVAGPAAGRYFGLDVMADNIQDDKNNATLFWVISKSAPTPAKTANRVVLTIDVPGQSDQFSKLIVALDKLDMAVRFVNSLSLQGEPYAFRYVVSAGSRKPIETHKIEKALNAFTGATVLGTYQAQ